MAAAGQSQATVVLAMGNNADGQLGTGMSEDGEDTVWEPTLVQALECLGVIAAAAARMHSVWLTQDGMVHTAGDNDEGQLGRSGKRSKPLKVDAIEHLPVEAVSAGDGFTVMAARLDGRLLGVGRGERGQLGMGGSDREQKDRVKFSSALSDEQLLALSAGEAHCVALSRSGKVLVFGENKNGQLGLGDFVSSATPKPVPTLFSRPVVSVCCGAAHTLARTATGLLWAWGCNDHGQLGVGDLRQRYRPEKVKLGVSRCAHVAAGSRHTLVISERGLLFAFGAGGCGQLGSGGIADAEATPRVVEALREVGHTLTAACGHSHSVALIWNEDAGKECLYSWGLGASGQLGLPRSSFQDRKFAPLPQRLRLDPRYRVVDIISGPLANHTFLLVAPADAAGGTGAGGTSPSRPAAAAGPASRSSLRTAIDADELLGTLRRLATTGEGGEAMSQSLKALTKSVGAAFSSASVLNASFRTSGRLAAASEEQSGVDLLKVRKAYSTLMFELKSRDVISILGRATLSICDELAKHRVPTDDAENLRVFLVLFENPLLLSEHRTALFPGFHLALRNLVAAVRTLPEGSQRMLFGWLKRLPSEYFGRVVDVVQQFVSFVLTQPGQSPTDASSAVLMLGTLWDLNREMDGILPEWCFHNSAISQSSDLREHYRQLSSGQRHVFSYCSYPFLLDADAKRRLLSFDAQQQREIAMQELVGETMRQGLPMQTVERMLLMRVRREHLISDFCGQLWWRIQHHRRCLRLPLSIEFVGELGVDAGGLRKECLQMVFRQLCERTTLFMELEEWPGLYWFTPTSDFFGKGSLATDAPPEVEMFSPAWAEHLPELAGAIVGLAVFNGIYLDLRLHPLVYRLLVARAVDVTFDDLRAVHPTLHRSLSSIREASDVRSWGLSWRVRLPGSDVETNLSGAAEEQALVESVEDARRFAALYAEAATVGAARPQIQGFVRAAAECMAVGAAYSLCTAHDLELLICGLSDIGSFKDLERSCKYTNGFSADSLPVRLFWQVVHGMSEVMKRKLLLFCTGCDRVPILGLKALEFVVARSSAGPDHLPTANTCVNQLNLPEYDTLDVARERIYAAFDHHAGFGFA